MTANPWGAGAIKAAEDFGLTKQAWAGLKEILVGHPEKYLQEAQSGKLFTRKGLLAKSLDPSVTFGPKWLRGPATVLNAGLLYGLPAYGVYEAAKAPEHQRGSAVGSALGSIIGSTLGMPLGLVGATAGNALGSALGESVGRSFNRKPSISEARRRDIAET